MGGRAKRVFGSQTPSKPAECSVLGAIRKRSVPGSRKNNERSGFGEGAYVPTLFSKRKMAEGCMYMRNRKKEEKHTWVLFNRGARYCGGSTRNTFNIGETRRKEGIRKRGEEELVGRVVDGGIKYNRNKRDEERDRERRREEK